MFKVSNALHNNINLETILTPLPEHSDHITPQTNHEIIKICGVDLTKFECYKCHKARHQTTKV